MINANVLIGQPIIFQDKTKIYPAKVKDVLTVEFQQYVRLLLITAEDIKDEYQNRGEIYIPTPFEFLLINCKASEEIYKIACDAFEFFLHQKVHFLYEQKCIVLGEVQDIITVQQISELQILNDENYFDFQNEVRKSIGMEEAKPPEPDDPNENPKIKAMKAKARLRDKIKQQKGTKDGISLSTCLLAICCMGIGITPLNIGEMSYAAINPIMSMYQSKEKYRIDIDSLLAGADSKKIKPKYWIKE